MSDKLTMTLHDPVQGHQAFDALWKMAKAHLTSGRRMVLELRPQSKSREQEEKYHALIGEIAHQASHLDCKWKPEDWKRLLLDKFARETGRSHGQVIPNLDKTGVVEVGILSRKFSVADACEFVEWLHAWGAENGVQFADLQGYEEMAAA